MNIMKAKSLEEFLKFHQIKPKNIKLYFCAISHSSYVALRKGLNNYEQLEFLGDSILNFLSSEYIFLKYTNLEPGKQTRVRSAAVRTETLAELSEKLGLVDILKTGYKQTANDVKNSLKVKADVFESILGAIYLDQGIDEARKFVEKYIFPVIDKVHAQSNKDSKTILQEYIQSFSKDGVTYNVSQNSDKKFLAKVIHDKQIFGVGIGNSKKEAEQVAAQDALSKLK
ncbi:MULTISPECIES: ribonuclease III [unclassified Mycoplasma]|uniref:ribonuclease III n=1 Tax=unclassified Mycoplasma TaxID=2683645 RepID=UPI00211CD76C|nr:MULTISPECIES: ribonuclease III [unclassified Mycoplasma]UUM19777.1 ribonuclease III [Mycoplasma sp. 1578d]UUM24760.1 ribonuclease III [Mycoplasma sp. 3686d]